MLWEKLLEETLIKVSYIRTSVSLHGMARGPPPLSTEPGKQQVLGRCSFPPGGPLLLFAGHYNRNVSPLDLGLLSQNKRQTFKNYHQN